MCEDLILKKLKEKVKGIPAVVPNAEMGAEAEHNSKAMMVAIRIGI